MTTTGPTDASLVVLAAAAALHAGFQLTVSVVVYPALARVWPEHWQVNHDAHSRLVAPLVVLTYGALVGSGGWALVEHPESAWVWLTVVAAGTAFAATALVAAPTHAKLARGKDPVLVDRLLLADRVRAVAAVVACGAALLSAL